jgi:predicted extracellular nuclease
LTLQPGQYHLVQQAKGAAGTMALPAPDSTGSAAMSATAGKVALVNGTTALASTSPTGPQVIDYVGFGATSSNFEGGAPAVAPSNTTAISRLNAGCTDTDTNSADFITAAPAPRNTTSALAWCAGAPAPSPAPSPSPAPAPAPAPGLTPIGQIQGAGHVSPLKGQTVTTTGVVTKVNNNSFFMQSLVPDNNPDTSDGILVFTSTSPTVHVGEHIQLTGLVDEFNVGLATNTETAAHPLTELKSISGLSVLSSGNVISPTVVTFPEVSNDDLEKVEGMLVRIDTELTVSQNYFLGRFGELTLSAGGRLIKPTNQHPAGTVAAQQQAADNARRHILLDDGSSTQNPNPTPFISSVDNTVRAGDTTPAITGVIDYGLATASNTGLADYKINPTEPVVFSRANPRTTSPATVGGNVKVASFNVLNYFTTFTNGATAGGATGQDCSLGASTAAGNCRGADSLAEFLRQRGKIVSALAAINADVVGLMEIQNNGNTAVQNLVDALNAAVGAGTYAAVSLPSPVSGSGSGTGTDAIRVAMIYKPSVLSLVGNSVSDTAAINNRPPLAQTFSAANGEKFTVIVNHFKSKSCDSASPTLDLDQGDGQGCFNDRRQQQAVQLQAFIQGIQADKQDNDVLVIGDLNAYGKEDPVLALSSQGLNDLLDAFSGTADYSYVFDGESGYLDHALASSSLLGQTVGATHWHINADEPSIIDYNLEFKQPACAACGPDYYTQTPYRSSDHDPVIVGLSLLKAVQGTARGDQLTGTAGDDLIRGGEGADVITTGAGRDVLVYDSTRDALDSVTDFTPGLDKIDLRAIVNALRATQGTSFSPLAGGYIQIIDTAAGVQIRIDTDGSAGPASGRPLVTLKGVPSSALQAARDLIL